MINNIAFDWVRFLSGRFTVKKYMYTYVFPLKVLDLNVIAYIACYPYKCNLRCSKEFNFPTVQVT